MPNAGNYLHPVEELERAAADVIPRLILGTDLKAEIEGPAGRWR